MTNASHRIDDSPSDAAAVWATTLDDGGAVIIRPICGADAERERLFIENLSPESRYHRFLSGMAHPSPALIKSLTEIDHVGSEAYVALIEQNGRAVQIGVSRFYSDADGKGCECAIAIADAWKHKGLGSLLMRRLIKAAKARHLERMYSIDAVTDADMHDFTTHMGFKREANSDDHTLVTHTLTLT
jgi:N-acetylglutamate synthase-like GNAT family acetyltransferase